MTPRLFRIHMRGAEERARLEHQGRAWLAWHAAYLPHMKRPPKFEQLLGNAKPPQRPVPWEAQLEKWAAFAEAQANAR